MTVFAFLWRVVCWVALFVGLVFVAGCASAPPPVAPAPAAYPIAAPSYPQPIMPFYYPQGGPYYTPYMPRYSPRYFTR